jgi:uncharacterized protein with HEPN domain
MEVEVRKYLYDIQQAVQRVTKFTAGKTFDDYDRTPCSVPP